MFLDRYEIPAWVEYLVATSFGILIGTVIAYSI